MMVSRNLVRRFTGSLKVLNFQWRSLSSQRLVVPVFKRVSSHPEKIAVRDEFGKYTYQDLLKASVKLASEIDSSLNGRTQERVALMCSNNASYVIAQWACWISGQIMVPMCSSHPQTVLRYLMSDSQCSLLIAEPTNEKVIADLCSSSAKCKPFILDPALRESALYKPNEKTEKELPLLDTSDIGRVDDFYAKNDAMIIYTSGSTGLPKGVVISFLNLEAQIDSMVKAWGWEDKDCILHVLPLYHIHGIVNALLTPLYVGARCVMMKEFDGASVWAELVGIKTPTLDRVTMFTGVPTMYARLIQEFDTKLNKSDRISDYIRQTCSRKIRLMLCGSAPLSRPIFDRWEEITGHKIVERYGMTETGMILSAPVSGERSFGNVGTPMPGVQVRIVSDERDGSKKIVARGDAKRTEVLRGSGVTSGGPGFRSIVSSGGSETVSGVLHVSGDSVASRYWNKPQATASDFKSGWFVTGDIVEYCDGNYTVMGRVSSDIIKTGGFKVSAIQVETVLSQHDSIGDVAVVPLEDPVWGEKVGIVVVVKENHTLDSDQLKQWASQRLPDYALPRAVALAPDGIIPRNHMGKINRAQLREAFFTQPPASAAASG